MTRQRRNSLRAVVLGLGLGLFVALQAAPVFAVTCRDVQVWVPNPGQGWRLVAPGNSGRAGAVSATTTEDARFSIRLDGPLQTRMVLQLSLVLPGGHRYQTLTVPVAPEDTTAGRRRLAGFPLPVEEHAVQLRADDSASEGLGRFVDVPFPVGGTAIVSSSLYGEWTVEAAVAGESCASTKFRIEE